MHNEFIKTQFFYIRDHFGQRIGAVAIGLTTEGRLKITGSVKSELDKVDPDLSRNIAINRLRHAFIKEGRRSQTRFLDLSIEEAQKLNLKVVLKRLGLTESACIMGEDATVDLDSFEKVFTDQVNHMKYFFDSRNDQEKINEILLGKLKNQVSFVEKRRTELLAKIKEKEEQLKSVEDSHTVEAV